MFCAPTACRESPGIGGAGPELRQPIDHVTDDVETIDLVHHDHVERRCGRSFIDISAHVKPVVLRPALHDASDRKTVAMVDENYRHASREVRFKLVVVHAMRMSIGAHQRADVHNVDQSQPQIRNVFPQQPRGRCRLSRGDVARAGKDHIGLASVIIAGKFPHADATRAVFARLMHCEPLQLRLLAAGNDVDEIARAQAVLHDVKETIAIRWEIDSHHLAFLHERIVDESRRLVTVPVMILPPDVTGQEHIQRCNRPSPGFRWIL